MEIGSYVMLVLLFGGAFGLVLLFSCSPLLMYRRSLMKADNTDSDRMSKFSDVESAKQAWHVKEQEKANEQAEWASFAQESQVIVSNQQRSDKHISTDIQVLEGVRAFLIKSGIVGWLEAIHTISSSYIDDLASRGFTLLSIISDYGTNIISYFQIVQTFEVLYDVDWPEVMNVLFNISNFVSLSVSNIPSLSCMFTEVGYFASFTLWMVLPVSLAIVCGILYSLDSRSLFGKDEYAMQLYQNCIIKFVLFFCFLIYIPVSHVSASMFNCAEIYGDHWLVADMQIQCYTEKHKKYMVFGGLGMLVYPIGIPLMQVLILRQYRIPQLYLEKWRKALLHQVATRYASEYLMCLTTRAENMVWTKKMIEVMYDRIVVSKSASFLLESKSMKHDVLRRKATKKGAPLGKSSSVRRTSVATLLGREEMVPPFLPNIPMSGHESDLRSVYVAKDDIATQDSQPSTVLGPPSSHSEDEVYSSEQMMTDITILPSDSKDRISTEQMMDEIIDMAMRSAPLRAGVVTTWSATMNIADTDLNQLQLEEKRALMTVGFLFAAYRPKYWWWEAVECTRKFALTSMMMFIEPGTSNQLIYACLINIIMVVLYQQIRPNESGPSLSIKTSVSLLLFYMFFVGFAISQGSMTASGWGDSILALNACIIFIPTLIGVYLTGITLRKYSNRKKTQKSTHKKKGKNGEHEDHNNDEECDVDSDFISGD